MAAIGSVMRRPLVLETHVDLLFCHRPAVAFYPGGDLKGNTSSFCGPSAA